MRDGELRYRGTHYYKDGTSGKFGDATSSESDDRASEEFDSGA